MQPGREEISERLAGVRDHFVVRNLEAGLDTALQERTTRIALGFWTFLVALAVVGPYITPYPYNETLYAQSGAALRNAPPSLAHPLGTTDLGYDVLSRLIYGVRPTVITGLLGGSMIITIGLSIGVTAGYVGGRVDNVLMRFTDFVYGVPLLPFAIVLLTFLGVGFITSVVVLGLLLWRGNARVLRAQVLQIKERPYIKSARATGASTPRIIFKHILPNVASMGVLFFSLGIGYSIILQAGLSFLGVSDPFVPSYGIMLRNVYQAGNVADAWWWSLPPGLMISLTVLSAFMFGRGYESAVGEENDAAFAEAG